MIRLQTERLIIRDPVPSDIGEWHRLMSDAKTMYYLPDIMTHSLAESQVNLDEAIAEAHSLDRTKVFLVMESCETGAFIGSIGYTVTQSTPVGKFVGVGYFILPEHHGQGYVTEALGEVLRYAFEEDHVYRVSTGCNAENRASERVMQKCGMIKEAEFMSSVWHDGRLCDRVEYRLLREEWAKGQSRPCCFWQALDRLIAETELVIDRPKGSAHPRYSDFIYPLDYGYLQGTSAMDGGGIDVWRGSAPEGQLDAVMCIVDLVKRDSEIKLLIGCTEDEKAVVLGAHNETEYTKGILIRREG